MVLTAMFKKAWDASRKAAVPAKQAKRAARSAHSGRQTRKRWHQAEKDLDLDWMAEGAGELIVGDVDELVVGRGVTDLVWNRKPYS